ncbi:autotransporter domain-containing protein [Methylacidiphilales bacterium]|nr:autotransporter domain-containing protein [Candidatus Methylacidiphilales bacterium]
MKANFRAVSVVELIVFGLLVTSGPTMAQTAPSLGTAQNVTILGDTTITNVGATIVNGDVWLSNQAAGAMITGFPPGTIVNGSQLIGGASTLQAHNDTLTAYTTLAGEGGAIPLTGDLGGRTLASGVYSFSSSAGLTGNLTLNTGGNPNAIFVFQIGTTLTTATASMVTVLGNPNDPNIFWQVGSSATLAGSTFSGDILADTSITLDPGAVLSDGKLLAIDGAVTLAGGGNTINLFGAGALPLGLQGTYWNGSASNLWSDMNWSPDATGATDENLAPGANVVFSVTGVTPHNENTILNQDETILSLTVNDTVPVTISGANTLTISGGVGVPSTITVNPGAGLTTINSNLVLGPSSQGITVSNAAGLVINGDVDGANGITKTGTGLLTLAGTNIYTGGTTIDAGTLAVGSAGALSTGFVTNNATLETTATSSGAPARPIIVNGAFTQSETGTLQLQIVSNQGTPPNNQTAAGVNYDTLTSTGAVVVAGALKLNFQLAAPGQVGQQFQAVSAGSSVTGTFNTVTLTGTSFLPFTTYNDSFGGAYAANNVVVTLLQPFNTFAGLTPNQNSVATYIDTVQNTSGGSGIFNNIVAGLTSASSTGNLGHALDELSPQRFEILRNVAFDNYALDMQSLDAEFARERNGQGGIDMSGFVFNDSTIGPQLSQVKSRLLAWSPAPEPGLLSDSTRAILGGVEMSDDKDMKDIKEMAHEVPLNRWNGFVDGGVDLGDLDSNIDASHSSYTTGRVRAGLDYRVSSDIRVGAMFGYGHTDVDLDNEGSKAHVDSFTPGIYATYADKQGFYANALFTGTLNEYTTDRNVIIPGFNQTATGSTSGTQFGGDLDGGYEFHKGNWTFGPSVGLTYVNLSIDSFNENGADTANLNINNQSTDSLRSRLGGTVSYRGKLGSVIVTPYMNAFWQHEFLDNPTSITSQFQGLPNGGSFSVQTTRGDSDNALLGFGVNAEVTPNVTLFVDYQAEAGGSTFFGQSASAGVKVGF